MIPVFSVNFLNTNLPQKSHIAGGSCVMLATLQHILLDWAVLLLHCCWNNLVTVDCIIINKSAILKVIFCRLLEYSFIYVSNFSYTGNHHSLRQSFTQSSELAYSTYSSTVDCWYLSAVFIKSRKGFIVLNSCLFHVLLMLSWDELNYPTFSVKYTLISQRIAWGLSFLVRIKYLRTYWICTGSDSVTVCIWWKNFYKCRAQC